MEIIPYSCEPKCATDICGSVEPRVRLVERQKYLQRQLDEINQAIAFFDANPSFEQGITLLQKALR